MANFLKGCLLQSGLCWYKMVERCHFGDGQTLRRKTAEALVGVGLELRKLGANLVVRHGYPHQVDLDPVRCEISASSCEPFAPPVKFNGVSSASRPVDVNAEELAAGSCGLFACRLPGGGKILSLTESGV